MRYHIGDCYRGFKRVQRLAKDTLQEQVQKLEADYASGLKLGEGALEVLHGAAEGFLVSNFVKC